MEAPVRDSVLVALASRLDWLPAAGARTPDATVRAAPAALPMLERRAHLALRLVENLEQLGVRDVGELPPRGDPGCPERLGLPEIADPGHEPLIEERFSDRATLVGQAKAGQHRVEIGREGEDVRAEPARTAAVQLEHGAVPEHGFALGAAEHEPWPPSRLPVPRPHLPASAHAQVAAQDEAALEVEQQVLADRLDSLEETAVEPLRESLDLGLRVRGLDLDALADEHLQAPRGAVDRIALGHASSMSSRVQAAVAGAIAATAWSGLEPIDKRLFRCDYSDVAVLGKAVTRGPAWLPLGLAMHTVNGAIFGLAYHEVRRRVSIEPRRLALGMALAEHMILYPLGYFVDRYHPARGEPGVPRLLTNPRAFGQATVRHALFGAVLGRLAR
jgi:hypothetical protein